MWEKIGIVVGIISGVLGIIVYTRTLLLGKDVKALVEQTGKSDPGA